MTLLDQIAQAFHQYDNVVKALGAIAAPGGIWFWVDKYRNRIRVKVRNFGFISGDVSGRGISLELENIGTSVTSMEPTFSVTAYTAKRERQTYDFRIEGQQRRLSPHDLLIVQGWHNNPESRVILFGWYMSFTFPLTRGRRVRIRVRNAQFEQLSWLRFHWERIRFTLFGTLGHDAL